MLQSVLTILLCIPVLTASKGEWSYENLKAWVRGNRYCAGKQQSPIDLQFNISHYDRRLKQIVLEKTDSQEQPELVNNGHTAQLNLKKAYVLKHIAPESEDYNVEQLHFHWGHARDDVNGSEHKLEGRSYPLEMHVVTYSNWYSNIQEAMTNTRALAVIGVFFELSEEENPLLKPLVNALTDVKGQGQSISLREEFNLKDLIGKERLGHYYRYDGSLTTPPCYESVVWTVLTEPLKLSFHQLHAFRYLHDDKAKLIENTYRTIRPLGTRKLFRSFRPNDAYEQPQGRSTINENNGQYLKTNMKLIVILTSVLMVLL